MNRYWMAATNAPLWLVLVGGLVVLAWHRRRAPRAFGMALPVVALLALSMGEVTTHLLFRGSYPSWASDVSAWFSSAGCLAFWAVLPVAIMADRKAGRHDDR